MTWNASQIAVEQVRKDFSILNREIHGKPLVYLDNAATTLKPDAVIEKEMFYYQQQCANIHRGVHLMSEEATAEFEAVRSKIAKFINAPSEDEVIFTAGTTQSINTVAYSFGELLNEGDEIIVSGMEHHSNIVPWQLLETRKGVKLKHIPVLENGTLDYEAYEQLLSDKTKLVSVVHTSNSLGTVNDVEKIISLAKKAGAKVLIDAAQAVAHCPVDVQALGCDFLVFSGHKIFGPTGTGVLWAKKEILDEMPPFFGGGDMIRSVSFSGTTFADIPNKFEAGTPNIAGFIGLGAAIDYVVDLGWEYISGYEKHLIKQAEKALANIEGLKFIGEAPQRSGAISFVMDKMHPHDIGTIVDRAGVAVRTGHHCTQPIMDRFGIPATTRASFSIYNTESEIELLVAALEKAKRFLL